MKHNTVRSKLRKGEPCVGTWLTLPDSIAARLMARTGLDWLTVELEHTPVTLETAAQSFGHIAAAGCVPLARVPVNSVENIKRVLDNGAWGIIVPMVNSRAEAQAVVRAARYQPLGERSIGGQLHAVSFDTDPATYYAQANDEILVVVMIEHVHGVAAAADIISVPGIDAVFIGPNDLLNSMGKPPAFDSDDMEFNRAIQLVRTVAKNHNVASGIHVIDAKAAQRRIAEGFQFIAVSSEAGLMLDKTAEVVKSLGLGPAKTVAKY